ncbi:hypothetical protein Tsubulata_003036 [Turnera subulata]|uniref:Atos-like C-terminal domain-containing protein n=1 Tax=Turnera subulata TaxID=218843 RepID=A0A9Q0G1P6_9ROSI|nr:hypothetical protein Tsubulata_003036 [Turnera subulata]
MFFYLQNLPTVNSPPPLCFLLGATWPPGFCLADPCTNPLHIRFTLHNMMPKLFGDFDPEEQLVDAWPELRFGNHLRFWHDQWQRHGAFQPLNPVEYFSRTVQLFSTRKVILRLANLTGKGITSPELLKFPDNSFGFGDPLASNLYGLNTSTAVKAGGFGPRSGRTISDPASRIVIDEGASTDYVHSNSSLSGVIINEAESNVSLVMKRLLSHLRKMDAESLVLEKGCSDGDCAGTVQRCKSDPLSVPQKMNSGVEEERKFYLYNDLKVVFPQRHSDTDEGKLNVEYHFPEDPRYFDITN